MSWKMTPMKWSVRDEDPDDLGGVIGRGSRKGSELSGQEHDARKITSCIHSCRKTSKPTRCHWNMDILNEGQVGSVSLL